MRAPTRREILGLMAAAPAGGVVLRPGAARTQSDPAEVEEVDLNILFAIDMSRSMDEDDELLQRQGYAEAFRNPAVINAITGGTLGRVACACVQWAGVHRERLTVPWTIVEDEASALAFADAFFAQPRAAILETYIAGAIRYCTAELVRAREIIRPLFGSLLNISGDGADTYGQTSLARSRDEAIAAGITINGIPVLGDLGWHSRSREPIYEPNLTEYYRNYVIGGPGAFVIEAAGYADLGRALVRKLVLEIARAESRGPRRG